jgi:hypothetical protein
MFWIMVEPEFHNGVVMCIPNPIKQIELWYRTSLGSVLGYFSVFVLIVWILRRTLWPGLGDSIIKRGRGRPKKD